MESCPLKSAAEVCKERVLSRLALSEEDAVRWMHECTDKDEPIESIPLGRDTGYSIGRYLSSQSLFGWRAIGDKHGMDTTWRNTPDGRCDIYVVSRPKGVAAAYEGL